MSHVEESLALLGYRSLDEVTAENLKERFKAAAKRTHPDHGGAEWEFDRILAAYTDLTRICRRQSGGRSDRQAKIYVEEVKEQREQQWVNEMNVVVNEVLDRLLPVHNEHAAFQKEFNEAFEKLHVRDTEHGYGQEEWFHSDTGDSKEFAAEPCTVDGFHSEFERRARQGKPPPTTLILHPEQMALRPSFAGYDPSRLGDYTADPYSCPDFTDLKEAYDTQATVIDKLPSPDPSFAEDLVRQFEDRLKERDQVYRTEADRDLELIAAYERAKEQEWKENERRMRDYFASTGSSVWALREHNL